MNGVLRSFLAVGIAIAIAYVVLCLLMFTQQRRFIYFPNPVLAALPSDVDLPYEEVWIPVNVGDRVEKMHAWWLPASGASRGTVLYLHGNGENIAANLGQAAIFHRLGYAVLLFDYRGYGLSEGEFPSEASLYQDAKAAWAYLTQVRQVPPRDIVLYGHSLGGAIAIYLAQRQPDAAALIVQSGFTSVRAMVDQQPWFRVLPVDILLTQRFPSLQRVPDLQVPVLYIHGTEDTIVPSPMSEALYAASPEPKQLYLIPRADHNNVAELGGMDYLETLHNFLQAHAQ